jgi:serine phosphatase RsbU (regulator of sigma subunit)
MAKLIVLQGPKAGHYFRLDEGCAVIGRVADVPISLPSQAVSRRHAQIAFRDGTYFLEDLGSANGTFLNQQRLAAGQGLADGDQVRVGDCILRFQANTDAEETEPDVLEQVQATISNPALYHDQPGRKLQILLALARHLGQALEVPALLETLLEHLLELFPLADRALAVLCEGERLVVRAHRSRRPGDADGRFSRAVVQRALADGAGLLSSDVHADQRFTASTSLEDVAITSVICAPLIAHQGKPLGVLQLDCARPGEAFSSEHLRLLTTVGLLAAVVLDNVALQALRAREEVLRRDLAVARDIQLGFLPGEWAPPPGSGFEVCARLQPARAVSGDLYDFFPLADGRLAFLVGDVSDKGVSAALFMVKVQTLIRHLAGQAQGPAATLAALNGALVANNPSCMFVTLLLGLFDPASGEVVLASGGHPRPLLRRADGTVAEVAMPVGRLLGCFEDDPSATDQRLTLAPGETLILYSDGYIEAAAPAPRHGQMGLQALKDLVGGANTALPLATCAEQARLAVEQFIGGPDLQDDLTLLLLRRL